MKVGKYLIYLHDFLLLWAWNMCVRGGRGMGDTLLVGVKGRMREFAYMPV